jgi:hypothetical protein
MNRVRITVPETVSKIYKWVCMQTVCYQDKATKEYYRFNKFNPKEPTDRILVSYNKHLPIDENVIAKCLDEVSNRWLECCFINDEGRTQTIISSYEYMTTEKGMEMSIVFGFN